MARNLRKGFILMKAGGCCSNSCASVDIGQFGGLSSGQARKSLPVGTKGRREVPDRAIVITIF
jgi:hypothetical protein